MSNDQDLFDTFLKERRQAIMARELTPEEHGRALEEYRRRMNRLDDVNPTAASGLWSEAEAVREYKSGLCRINSNTIGDEYEAWLARR